jgi:hypothetical protein
MWQRNGIFDAPTASVYCENHGSMTTTTIKRERQGLGQSTVIYSGTGGMTSIP